MPNLRVHFVPELVEPAELAGRHCVVIDVLRATTTILAALSSGARSVMPCLSVEDARRLAASLSPSEVVLGGERGGLPIEGFKLGNSPAEYTPSAVAGRTVVLTTTNGTKALLYCRQAAEVLGAAFANLSALCNHLCQRDRRADADVVCAGTEMRVSWDDVLVAGAMAHRLAGDAQWRLDDQASIARAAWLAVYQGGPADALFDRLAATLSESRGGRNLCRIDMQQDVRQAAVIDATPLLARFDATSGAVVSVGSQGTPPEPR